MIVIEAPKMSQVEEGMISCFLAGGITNCPNWQVEVIDELDKFDNTDNLILFNPRRSKFDITDPTLAETQIAWEFVYLNNMDIFSMYFSNSEYSVQPICLYELGRHLVMIQYRFPKDFKDRIIVSVEESYSRKNDVFIQTKLAVGSEIACFRTPKEHAKAIYSQYIKLLGENHEK